MRCASAVAATRPGPLLPPPLPPDAQAKGPEVDPTKAVRVFLRFASRDSAVRGMHRAPPLWRPFHSSSSPPRPPPVPAAAHQGLDGRFFDKRRIEARFFDEQRFANLDFQLRPGEV